jgi:hypothetical protein
MHRADPHRTVLAPTRSAPDFAFIETDTAERTEAKSATGSVLVGYLDSESSSAIGALRAVKMQQRTEHHTYAKDSHRGHSVAVRDFGARSCSENKYGNGSDRDTDHEKSSRPPRTCSEVFADRHGQQSYTTAGLRNIRSLRAPMQGAA